MINYTKVKGYGLVSMLAVLLVLSFVAKGISYFAEQQRLKNAKSELELMVKNEADTLEYAYNAIDVWFRTSGRAALYSCESSSVSVDTAKSCDAGVIKNILPDYHASISTQAYNSINSSTIGYHASVVKVARGTEFDYKIVVYPAL